MMQWISVEKRLPGMYDWVLVAVKLAGGPHYMATAYRNKTNEDEDWYWWWFGYPADIGNVTHWMPLPNPPSETRTNADYIRQLNDEGLSEFIEKIKFRARVALALQNEEGDRAYKELASLDWLREEYR